MPIPLKDIPHGKLTPDEVESIANDTFDYADREQVSLREAERKIKEESHNDSIRRQFIRLGDWDSAQKVPSYDAPFVLEEGYGDFTFKEKSFEVAKSVHRGLGSVAKLPGVAMKAFGELGLTRREIAELKKSPYALQQFRAKVAESSFTKIPRSFANTLRKAGNKYIDIANGMMIDESPESRGVRSMESFGAHPFYRTAMAVGESAPSYGIAVASTIASGNPNIGLFVLGTTTASSAYENYRDMNIDPDLALLGAAVEGSIEVLTEKVPMDMLMKGAGRPFLIRALRLGTAESFQELFAQLGQNYTQAVVKDIDPENYATALKAANQQWSVISQGWQDAMAAGFAMGGGAAAFSPSVDLGLRTSEELKTEYGFTPRNTPELLSLMEQVKDKVKAVEEQEPVRTKETKEVQPEEVFGKGLGIGEAAPQMVVKAQKPTEGIVTAPTTLKGLEAKQGVEEIGEGEIKPRGTSVSVMAQAIEDELVSEHQIDDIPVYRAMNMKEQAEKALVIIESDIEKAKRIAFYKEAAPPDLFPENVFTALRVYARESLDLDLIMDLALNEDVVREHTIMGKRIKSLDTDQDFADPVSAIRTIVEARTEQAVRKGEDLSALESKLRELEAELARTKKAKTSFTQKATRAYGTKNKLVSRTEYNSIIARRKTEVLKHTGRTMGAVYVPNAQDFIDIAKIATFHLEAMGRDFAKWSYQMEKDFGKWITPYLQDEYDKALKGAKKAGIEIKESKRLATKKKRLATTTKKLEGKIKERDLEKTPPIPIELDEEGRRLQTEYDLAREKYKAAQAVANFITEEEVRIIAQLAKDASTKKTIMEKSTRREVGALQGTKKERAWGLASGVFSDYVSGLKNNANKKTIKQVAINYLTDPLGFVSDLFGTFKTARASYDNSYIGRQGRKVLFQGITGDIKSLRIWVNTFINSFVYLIDPLRHNKALKLLYADMISDPDFKLLKQSKVAINVIEEELPVDILNKIPLVGMGFKMSESAYVGSGRFMRYAVAKKYFDIWRKSGKTLDKRELMSIGSLTNSQTGRGGTSNQKPGWINNIFWSPRMILGDLNYLTMHLFDKTASITAKKHAAINLLRYIGGAGMILQFAKWIDDDSVTWDITSSDFGKIKIGNTRFSVGGGTEILIILAARLYTRTYTSSVTGKTKSIDSGKWGALAGKDLVWNFMENKLSPGASLALSLINQKTWDGDKLTIPQMVNDAFTPLVIQNVFETGSVDDSANVLAALMAEALGVNVQTYGGKKGTDGTKR